MQKLESGNEECKGRNALAPRPFERARKGEREKSFLWDEENRLLAENNNGSVSCYFYDAAGERTVKLTSETEMVHVNGKKVGGNDAVTKFIAYVSPYFVVSNGGAYTKHIYALILQWHAVCVSFYSSLKVLTLYFN